MTWTPLPPESASHTGSGTGQIWVTSSRAISSGGSSRPPGDGLAELGRDPVDLAGQRGEQRRERASAAAASAIM